jgi:uncharacterized protein
MVTDPRVFQGRQKECSDIIGRLKKMESTSIVGPRRIGKSSLAYHIYSSGPDSLGDNYVLVWLDGQSNHLSSMDRMFARIAEAGGFKYTPGSTTYERLVAFEDCIIGLGKKLVVLINEFEILTDDHHKLEFARPFYNTLRMLAEQSRCALVTTSYTSLTTVCGNILEVSSPFYNIFAQVTLGEYSAQEVDEFLRKCHLGFSFTTGEQQLIRTQVADHQHPLILHIAADAIFMNRTVGLSDSQLLDRIDDRARGYLSHEQIQEGRRVKQQIDRGSAPRLSKALDLTVSIMVPLAALTVLMLEYGLLMQRLSVVQAILLGLVTMVLGFGIIVFAGRSIDVIGESTFFKLFIKIIDQTPFISTLARGGERAPAKSTAKARTSRK